MPVMSATFEAEESASVQPAASARGKRKPGPADDEACNSEEEQAE